jgi:hypothetical protein
MTESEDLEFEDWDDFCFKLATETPYDLQLMIIDDGDRLNWFDQGITEVLFTENEEFIPKDLFETLIRNFVTNQIKELNEDFEYELRDDCENKINLFVEDAVARYRRYWDE